MTENRKRYERRGAGRDSGSAASNGNGFRARKERDRFERDGDFAAGGLPYPDPRFPVPEVLDEP